MVAAGEPINLRPAPFGNRAAKEVVQAAEKRGLSGGGGSGGGDDVGEETQFGDGRAVVDRADIAGLVAGALAGAAGARGEIGVLVPVAGGSLKRDDVGGDTEGVGGCIPGIGIFQRKGGPARRDERSGEGEGEGLALFGVEDPVGGASLVGAGEVVAPSGVTCGGQAGDTFGGDGKGGRVGADDGGGGGDGGSDCGGQKSEGGEEHVGSGTRPEKNNKIARSRSGARVLLTAEA